MSSSIARKKVVPIEATEEMYAVFRDVLECGTIEEMIEILYRHRFTDRQRLWIMWKASQVQAGRNIIAAARTGLELMGFDE